MSANSPMRPTAMPRDWRAAAIAATAALLVAGQFMALLYAPEERTMRAAQRIFYVHVPSAWVGFLAFGVVFVASVGFLWTRRRAYDLTAHASTEVGVVFTTLAIATGMVWGRYAWGTWWSWDPRLTTTFMLWLIYVVSLMVRAYGGAGSQPARFAAVLGIVGFLDIPLIHLSVVWWRSLHPLPVVMRAEGFGSGLHPAMLQALLVNVAAFTVLYAILFSLRREQMAIADRLAAGDTTANTLRPGVRGEDR
ncbi:MAG: cytochrome c biogenesis protein CcsA [Armatimonadota bacterium]|nr:cytochrome c biogenesis protein CcsA [Armatimonadota bacterium]MDR7437884.1 cytochrome c biogenesis protein CcsA [Armatimonadota bacterium]MDR7473302.1 cytochrome c biogenesis protein CcsA [Armatimonadota bacterium]MDR7507642.1 cytochrome c biogenesis protein CcsA [Armatimonadota bacterium]MDR7510014.1 cytochrome c biogenesis protein CcsA [Armatimonadota bacterium]